MKAKRMITAFLSAVLLLGLAPLSAVAADPDSVIDISNIGKIGEYACEYWEFDGEKTFTIKDDVTVIGGCYDLYDAGLVFELIPGMKYAPTLYWIANYGGESTSEETVLIDLKGEGSVEIDANGSMALYGGGTALKTESGISVTVSGYGSITAFDNNTADFNLSNRCVAIDAGGCVSLNNSAKINVRSTAGCTGINAGGDVTIDGWAEVTAYYDVSYYLSSMQSVAIRSAADIMIDVKGGGYIQAYSGIIAKNADVSVSGDSRIIALGWLTYADGELFGNAITAKNVTVRDNAQVSAKNGAAAYYSGELDVSGGALFAYGGGIGGGAFEISDTDYDEDIPDICYLLNVIFKTQDSDVRENVVYADCGSIEPGACNGIILAWDIVNVLDKIYDNESPGYERDGNEDIYGYSDEITDYWWVISRLFTGIEYTLGKDTNRFSVDFSLIPFKPLKYKIIEDPGADPDPDPGADPDDEDQKDPGNTGSGNNNSNNNGGWNYGNWTQIVTSITDQGVPLAAMPFTDVATGAWYYSAVSYVYEKGLVIGTADDRFSPNSTLTRGMIVTILYRNAGEPGVAGVSNPFSDVPGDTWYTDAVKWASSNGIINGYGNGKFGPEDPVTKEQLAALIYRTQQASGKIPQNSSTGKSFADANRVSDWAEIPVSALNAQGVFGDLPGGSFSPRSAATRAEVASMLYRYLTAI